MVRSPNNFFPIFYKNVAFFGKIVTWKNIQNLISQKKRLYSFSSPDVPFPSKETVVFPFSQKIQPFLKKLLNKKIFSASFVIKKVMLIFGAKRLLSLKNCQRCLQNSFWLCYHKWWIFKKSITIDKLKFLSIIDNTELIDKIRSLSILLTALVGLVILIYTSLF